MKNADLDYCGGCFGNSFDQHCEKLQEEMTMPPGISRDQGRPDFSEFGPETNKTGCFY